ncbi:uncharacterized protein RAG0_12719 [Rhynchosporium agropyri]|uniref:Uncharacterized protein n=1 Tax=Rhynchosporium agropyri TaxID=914238 RepID=A0A1E1L9E2_9HELO|nr:uncharacterized protein RAG0_12719 [Rhynchosporium agropyri]
MYLLKAATAGPVLRQATEIVFPSACCSPQCPWCRTEVAKSDGATTSCVANSSFITNCGACQQRILTYNIETGRTEMSTQLEVVLISVINLCSNTTVAPQVLALQSQAARISRMGIMLASATSSSTTSITLSTKGSVNNPSSQSVLATAIWAAEFSSSKAAASTFSLRIASSTSIALSAAESTQPLHSSWVAGPVIGSVFGLSTVIVVIFVARIWVLVWIR